MSIMDFLFPGVAMARQEALARIKAGRRQMDEAHAAEAPIRALAREVLPLIEAVELEGKRPEIVEVPADRLHAVIRGRMESDAIYGRWQASYEPALLFGLRIVEGPELRVR